jgi:hypothetical protein
MSLAWDGVGGLRYKIQGIRKENPMAITRTIVAVLVALSVAILPIASGALLTLKPIATPAETSASNLEHDCCDQDSTPCQKSKGDCTSMATCALKYFNFAGLEYSNIEFPIVSAALAPAAPQCAGPLTAAIPPFRPPRV